MMTFCLPLSVLCHLQKNSVQRASVQMEVLTVHLFQQRVDNGMPPVPNLVSGRAQLARSGQQESSEIPLDLKQIKFLYKTR